MAINGKKYGVQGFNIYMRLKGESAWNKESFVSHLPFMDHHPAHTPGQSENREYMAIGVIQDNEIGQMSGIVSVAFAG